MGRPDSEINPTFAFESNGMSAQLLVDFVVSAIAEQIPIHLTDHAGVCLSFVAFACHIIDPP